MRRFSILIILFAFISTPAAAQQEAPQTSLNHYIEFLSKSSELVIHRFKMLGDYQEEVSRYRKRPDYGLRLPSSGPLEEYYYKKALGGLGVEAGKRKQLNAGLENVWEVLNKLDGTCKGLETYVRLRDYERDNLKKSDMLVAEMQSLFERYAHDKNALYTQIRQIYAGIQNRAATDPYIVTEKAMGEVIAAQQRLLEALPYYLDEETKTEWPVALVRQSMLDDEKALATIGNTASQLQYPASDMVGTFKSALVSMQDIKRRALDDHNFAAQQSARHGNAVYLSLVEQFNHDMLEFYKAFVGYSKPGHLLLNYPFFSPVMKAESSEKVAASEGTKPFQDKSFQPLNVKKATAPASMAVIKTLNQYVDWINQSLRQMHLLQMIVRNYQSSAEYYRDPAKAQKRANLSYSHEDFKLPSSEYALLLSASTAIPEPYRKSVTGQAGVLMDVLQEMDGLSIELIRYTAEKRYLQDHLKRSDAILDRYLVLFDILDKKKEQLYNDIRRIHESYPNATPQSSWYIAGNAMLKTMDNGHDVMFGMRDYLRGETPKLPETTSLKADSRQLIADEYKNMKGLQRYGRSNGLCPYTPYEDLGTNAGRFAEKVEQYKPESSGFAAHPYESFYYFYNNELVYQYNNFIELSKAGLLKTINQPDVFAFRRSAPRKETAPPVKAPEPPVEKPADNVASVQTNHAEIPAVSQPPARQDARPLTNGGKPGPEAEAIAQEKRDTVYVERVRVDTVYVDRNAQLQNVTRSLDGFAPNNMVLLLDVSSSMNSPYKLPLLKRSIKSLLTLVRPEDMISIVLYSGKARVVLKPTSGARSAEISRMIDLLQSDGDTDGNEGIKLAYKTANKQYIRAGNNRIILATDGEFPVSNEVVDMIRQNARQDVYLSVFTFGRNEHTGQKLKKLSELGMGSYAHVTDASADLQLILEAQAKKLAGK